MGRLVLAALLLVGSCFGQISADTVYATLATDFSSASSFISPSYPTSGYIPNIGQPYHMVLANFSDLTGQVCPAPPGASANTVPIVTITISYDNITYFAVNNVQRTLTPQSTGPTSRFKVLATASGTFPYVRVTVSNFDNTQCKVSAWYSGGKVGVDVSKKFIFCNTTTECGLTTSVNITSATTTTIVPAVNSAAIAVFGMTLYNSTTAGTITFQQLNSDTTTNTLFVFNTVAAGQIINLPVTDTPYFQTNPGSALRIITSGAGPLSGFVDNRYQ